MRLFTDDTIYQRPISTKEDQAVLQNDLDKLSVRCLGVTLTSDTNWETHINAATNKASRTLELLRQTLKTGAKLVKEQAHKSFFRPVLKYTCSMWDPQVKHIKSLEAILQVAAHWILQRYCRTSILNDMLTALGWPSLQSMQMRQTLQLF